MEEGRPYLGLHVLVYICVFTLAVFFTLSLRRSPLSQQNEVSCFGSDGNGDIGDNWRVQVLSQRNFWKQGDEIRLRHEGLGYFLHSHKHRYDLQIIQGQQEVTSYPNDNADNIWIAEEGVYFPNETF